MRGYVRRRMGPLPPLDELENVELSGRAWRLFDVIDAKIEHADVKAGVVLGACGVITAAVLALITNRASQDIPLTITAAASGVLVILAAAFSCGVLWPRRLKRTPPGSHLYFDHIARRSAAGQAVFEKELRNLLSDPDALTDEIISQVQVTARLASRKYNFLDRAMLCLFGSLLGLAACTAIFAISYQRH